jgi:hypothetical protein
VLEVLHLQVVLEELRPVLEVLLVPVPEEALRLLPVREGLLVVILVRQFIRYL